MSVYLGRDRKHATAVMTAVYATVSGLSARIGNLDTNSTWTIFSPGL
jgi:hypothetical protein